MLTSFWSVWLNLNDYPLQSLDDFHSSEKLILSYFFSITHPFDEFKENFWFFLFRQNGLCSIVTVWWLKKVDMLTSLTPFSHKMISIVQKN